MLLTDANYTDTLNALEDQILRQENPLSQRVTPLKNQIQFLREQCSKGFTFRFKVSYDVEKDTGGNKFIHLHDLYGHNLHTLKGLGDTRRVNMRTTLHWLFYKLVDVFSSTEFPEQERILLTRANIRSKLEYAREYTHQPKNQEAYIHALVSHVQGFSTEPDLALQCLVNEKGEKSLKFCRHRRAPSRGHLFIEVFTERSFGKRREQLEEFIEEYVPSQPSEGTASSQDSLFGVPLLTSPPPSQEEEEENKDRRHLLNGYSSRSLTYTVPTVVPNAEPSLTSNV